MPVLNALSSLWHPTQVLADLLTLTENAHLFDASLRSRASSTKQKQLEELRPLTLAYVGDCANVLNDMLVTYPRLGHNLRVGAPENPKYRPPKAVWDRVVELGCDKRIVMTADPREAVHGADVVLTDTWISMGQEAEKEQRLKDFEGFQVTEQLCKEGGANPEWKFMHCLPRKQEEVDDEVRPKCSHSGAEGGDGDRLIFATCECAGVLRTAVAGVRRVGQPQVDDHGSFRVSSGTIVHMCRI